MKKAGRYPTEFKREAVRLLNLGEKPVTDLARELGVKRSLLYRWRDELNEKGEKAFSGSGRSKTEDLNENAKLRKELEKVTLERDILKKAAAYFAKDLG